MLYRGEKNPRTKTTTERSSMNAPAVLAIPSTIQQVAADHAVSVESVSTMWSAYAPHFERFNELRDGSKGVVQALGNSFGSLQQPPFIALDGDDRSGSVSGGPSLGILPFTICR